MGGTIAALGANSGTLLTGTLTAFGFPVGPGQIFEFLFTPTGGDLLTGFGTEGGIILDAGANDFTGSFDPPFSNSANSIGGSSDSFFEEDNPPSVPRAIHFGLSRHRGSRHRTRRPLEKATQLESPTTKIETGSEMN